MNNIFRNSFTTEHLNVKPEINSYYSSFRQNNNDSNALKDDCSIPHSEYGISLDSNKKEGLSESGFDVEGMSSGSEDASVIKTTSMKNERKDRKRSKNFTEREKKLLITVAKEFDITIENKKTDSMTVEAKKQAWGALTKKYNALSETGVRTEKQLHALYDVLKKQAKRNISSKPTTHIEGTFSLKQSETEDKVVPITPQFKQFGVSEKSSAPSYNQDTESQFSEDTQDLVIDESKETISDNEDKKDKVKRQASPKVNYGKTKKLCFNDILRKNENPSTFIFKRKNQRLNDLLMKKRLDILEIQHQYEVLKLKKSKILLDLDVEIKKIQLENAKLDLKNKKNCMN